MGMVSKAWINIKGWVVFIVFRETFLKSDDSERLRFFSISVSHLINRTLPWDYDFEFVVEEISNINDKSQVSQSVGGHQT